MLILFSAATILVGSAWCSYLCYIGSWDNLASFVRKKPTTLPGWWNSARIGIFLVIILTALGLRLASVNASVVNGLTAAFGLAGIGVMALISRSNGTMTHCTVFCPIGLAADILGKISPFRVRFEEQCDGCAGCSSSCRYNALTKNDIDRRKPGLSCTLCGDCLSSCPKNALRYSLWKMHPEKARLVFVSLIVSLHAVFLGTARI
jgi:polyferredoxin